ncbi:MAG: alpha/beta hydrolase [Pseudolabrys sp.]|nr:alpha/beta hydrolase [Pseudolabrys sp.]MCW5683272.1 alpha/beta hydrolase [Pseudolabrys sp.]
MEALIARACTRMSRNPSPVTAEQPWHLDAAIRSARIDSVDWPYIDTGGNGPVLVMLPGSVGTCEMFFKQIAALGDRFRIISVSYPAEPDPTALADGLARLMDTLGLARASVLGSSFGGYWAQFFALLYPQRVETLFLGNIFVTPDELFANPLFAPDFVRATAAADLQATWHGRVMQAAESELKRIQLDMLAGRQSAENLRARFLGVIDAKLCPPLRIPASQVVIVDCADDPIIPPASRQAVRDRYPQAEVATLPTGGHYPHILNPDAYDAVIARRLRT